jgi:PEP-CTERM motif
VKLKHLALGVLAAVSIGHANAQLAMSSNNLGTNPVNKFVLGAAFGGPSIANYTFSLAGANPFTFSGVLAGFGDPIDVTGITLQKLTAPSTFSTVATTTLNPSSAFSFAGLSAGNYRVRFALDTEGIGYVTGTVTAAAVPEAGSVALALAGVGVAAFAARRRKQAA